MQWWLWRVGKVSPKAPKVTKAFELSWPYVRDINRRTMERAELEHEMRDEVLPAVHRQGKPEEWSRDNVGYMTTVKVKQRGPGGQTFWLMPPLTKFADLTGFYPESGRVKHGHPEFWIQPEVFQHTGEIYQGTIGNLIPIEFSELQKHATTEESGGHIIAALDSFQAKGGVADPRFLKPNHSTRRKSPVQLDREIATALSRSPLRSKPKR
jgi:hypothetical protein